MEKWQKLDISKIAKTQFWVLLEQFPVKLLEIGWTGK